MKPCINCRQAISDDALFCPFCSTKQKETKKKNTNKPKTVINPEDFDNSVPVEVKEQQNVFSEKAEVKAQRVENEKKKIEEEKKQVEEEKEQLVKEKEEEVERLTQLALHDELTGLKNRTAFERDLKEIDNKNLCCISIDANNLKKINDTMGHKYGDCLLKAIAEALKEIFNDNAYRVGGDEFIVLINGEGETVINHKIEAVHSLLKEEEKKFEEDFEITAAIGAAYSNGTNSIKEIMEEADINMYKEKKAFKESNGKKNLYADFEPNFDGYYDDVKAEYEEAVKDNKSDTIKTIIKVGIITVIAITVWVLIFVNF